MIKQPPKKKFEFETYDNVLTFNILADRSTEDLKAVVKKLNIIKIATEIKQKL